MPTWSIKRLARETDWADPEEAALALMGSGEFRSVTGVDTRLGAREARRARDFLRTARSPTQPLVVESTSKREYSEPDWPRPVKNQKLQIEYADVDSVIQIHEALTVEFRGTPDAVDPPGIKDNGGLNSAVGRAEMAAEKYHSVPLAAAALVHGLVLNHPFHNGNKRTALLSLAIFLEQENGWYLKEGVEDELYEIVVAVASHTIVPAEESLGPPDDPYYSDREVLELHERLLQITEKPQKGNEYMQWRLLKKTLERLGCEVDPIQHNKTKIRRALSDGRTLQCTAGARNDGHELDANFIADIRKRLELTEENGFDYAVFYGGKEPHPPLPDLITRYRPVLERLALLDRSE